MIQLEILISSKCDFLRRKSGGIVIEVLQHFLWLSTVCLLKSETTLTGYDLVWINECWLFCLHLTFYKLKFCIFMFFWELKTKLLVYSLLFLVKGKFFAILQCTTVTPSFWTSQRFLWNGSETAEASDISKWDLFVDLNVDYLITYLPCLFSCSSLHN